MMLRLTLSFAMVVMTTFAVAAPPVTKADIDRATSIEVSAFCRIAAKPKTVPSAAKPVSP